MAKFRRVVLPDGTHKIEVVPESPEIIEERRKLHEELYKREKEHTYKKFGFKNNNDYIIDRIKKLGFENIREYQNDWAKRNGYENINEYNNEKRHERGTYQPMCINKECPLYLGVHITENVLMNKIFPDAIKMPNGNPGFDYLDPIYGKLDAKSSCLSGQNQWLFNINENKIADHFVLFGYDKRKDLDILHIWLIKNDEIIYIKSYIGSLKRKLNEIQGITFTNSKRGLMKYKKYELVNEIKKVINEKKSDIK